MRILFVVLFGWGLAFLTASTPILESGVYTWSNLKAKKVQGIKKKQVLTGSTTDLEKLNISTVTLSPGQIIKPDALTDREELIIVKEGTLNVSTQTASKTLGVGGIALAIAGEKRELKNTSGQPVTYYILAFKSKAPVNTTRGQVAGSFLQDWSEMVIKKTDKGESRANFDRPTPVFTKFDMHATALNPGFASHAPHTHRSEEIMLLLQGEVEAQIGEEFRKATAGDVIFIRPDVPHALKNIGKQPCGYFAIKWQN